ncbi:MAG: NAD-dependent deacylase [bacterium]
MSEKLLHKAAELIRNSKKTVALTGAGISTPSGIPDFRTPGKGLWEKVDPVEVATIETFRTNPENFFTFMAPFVSAVETAPVNPAHQALADWETMGLLNSIITQNIDNLHRRAGSKKVIELHGNSERAHCMKCRKLYGPDEIRARIKAGEKGVPRCDCGGVIKPDVVLFGEQLPYTELVQAERDSESCDVMIVVGSSLTVAPASFMPRVALQNGAKLIVVNLQETYIDPRAEIVLREKVEEALPMITELIKASN